MSVSGREEELGKEKERNIRIIFWNVAGITNKDEDFWEYLKEYEIIVLIETWTEEREWEKRKEGLPKGYDWKGQMASREKKKGRASGGILVGIKEGIKWTGWREITEGLIEVNMEIKKEKWKIIAIYNKHGSKELIDKLQEELEEEKGMLIIGGDFNGRIGTEGELIWDGNQEGKRNSRDKTINREGEYILDLINRNGWGILNGNCKGDEEGEWTYIGRGNSVVDYICNAETWEEIEEMKVGERGESDHQPLEIRIRREIKDRKEKREREWIIMEEWSENGVEKYREKMRRAEWEGITVNEQWEDLARKINEAIEKKKVVKWTRKTGEKRWWDKECKVSKRKVTEAMKNYKKGRIKKEELREEKRRHKAICEEKKQKQEEKDCKEIQEIKNENEIWKFINKERRKRGVKSEKIDIEDWESYFRTLLDGQEERKEEKEEPMEGEERREEEDREKEEKTEISREEVKNAIKRLRKKSSRRRWSKK